MDIYDSKGENPYEIEEILEDKVWRVSYRHLLKHYSGSKKKKSSPMDLTSETFRSTVLNSAKRYGDEAVKIAENDLKIAEIYCNHIKEGISKKENVDFPPSKLNMLVVKLDNGDILLYAPVIMHKEAPNLLMSWLESLGPVNWLVLASSAHDLCLPDAINAFPKAKVVGSKFAEEKLKYAKVLFNFVSKTNNCFMPSEIHK